MSVVPDGMGCPHCPARFMSRVELAEHIRRHAPTPDEICTWLRATAPNAPRIDEREKACEAADLIQQQQADIERLSALVEESLYHLRLDEAAKAYHERALTALGKDASDE